MHSEVTNVPKGSGLGTSSILSAACVKAVFEFMGIAYTEEDLYRDIYDLFFKGIERSSIYEKDENFCYIVKLVNVENHFQE